MIDQLMLSLPWPPSNNRYYRHIAKGPLAGRVLLSEEGRLYRKAVDSVIRQARARYAWAMPVRIDVAAYPPDRRKRDLDNMLKAVLDSLQASGVYENDSQICDLRIWRAERVVGGQLIVTVQPLGGDACG